MKHLLLTTTAAVLLVGCPKTRDEKNHILLGASGAGHIAVVRKALTEGRYLEYDSGVLMKALKNSIDSKNFEISDLIITEVPQCSSGRQALIFFLDEVNSKVLQSNSSEKDFLIKLIGLVQTHYPQNKKTTQFFVQLLRNGKVEIADFLINQGIKLNSSDASELLQASYDNAVVIEFLLKHGADINFEDDENGSTVLDRVIFNRSGGVAAFELKEQRLNQGGISKPNSDQTEKNKIIELLKYKGGKANSDNSIFLAIKHFNKAALINHLDDTSKINFKDADGNTPLHYAAETLNKKLVEILLNKGENSSAKKIKG